MKILEYLGLFLILLLFSNKELINKTGVSDIIYGLILLSFWGILFFVCVYYFCFFFLSSVFNNK